MLRHCRGQDHGNEVTSREVNKVKTEKKGKGGKKEGTKE